MCVLWVFIRNSETVALFYLICLDFIKLCYMMYRMLDT